MTRLELISRLELVYKVSRMVDSVEPAVSIRSLLHEIRRDEAEAIMALRMSDSNGIGGNQCIE